ncbi:toxin-antitoxin system YwqK family antitoxin [Bacteroides sp. 224]|uniref:toxin-antitoxin system YwqK family antitoxin n=1 Tax=Bacteroides sp. 224 TaxID=2302936 RepID=UPI0013CF6FFD|nr:hypothetical protein [Bacteroides sp. 224]
MEKIILLITFLLISASLSAQNDVEEIIIQMSHFYQEGVQLQGMLNENTKIGNSTYIKWVAIDDDGIFHSFNKSVEFPLLNKTLEAWDSLYLSNRENLTFYFEEEVYKHQDTTHISDVHTDVHKCAGYIKGVFINGKKEGLWTKYISDYFEGKYDTRKVIEESYKDGVLHGVRKVYELNGEQLDKTIFVNGTGCYNDYYYDTGKRAVLGHLVYGKPHGEWIYYNKMGNVIRKEQYKHGLFHGDLTIYDNSGNLIFETNFKNGTGKYRHYRNEILKERGQMINGQRVGIWTFIGVGSNSLTPNQDSDIRQREYDFMYKDQDPINDASNIIDVMFYDGEYLYLRATKCK